MNAYVYQAALYCERCGVKEREALDPYDPPEKPDDESSYDSDDYPKGPYANGGGEADYPCHCDTCGEFLQNPLTADGDKYVREKAAAYEAADDSWEQIAAKADAAGHAALAQWLRFYYAPGQ